MSVMQERESALMMEELSNKQDQEYVMQKLSEIEKRVKESSLSKSRTRHCINTSEWKCRTQKNTCNKNQKKKGSQVAIDQDDQDVDRKFSRNIEQSEPYAVLILSKSNTLDEQYVFDLIDNFPRWRRQFLYWKVTYNMSDYFCLRYIMSQCLYVDVQYMIIAQNLNNFGEVM
ncbi:hypothetical protein RFI_03512 [Reticulomyxa filosa]|uniref:Uncharacterized protein n=1 Tax=Reticulomyxa filosa TaxID=46433 RepID=X6P672_RETFI|nr:hypothetical protein RFI_03512 [Reticulomyxa filosa]|eukprot:ETO33589.1 hypothetical protein RFI_03512 [Reticulomyxa filosa]